MIEAATKINIKGRTIMELQKYLVEINKVCATCEVCDPSCTGNLIKKCIERDRVILKNV